MTQIRQVYLIVNIVLSAKITKSMKMSLDVLSLSPGLQWLDLCRPPKKPSGILGDGIQKKHANWSEGCPAKHMMHTNLQDENILQIVV